MTIEPDSTQALVIPRSEHSLSREEINDSALKVLYRLKKAGYQAYLVGGGVRDLLLGKHPKDFDIATDARPEEIRELFRNCRLIGRRFRLAHIHFGSEIVEVATFRGHHEGEEGDEPATTIDGMILRDNVYGTLAEDAWRRDFTVNAIYYNIADFSLVDYTGGFEDLKNKRLRMIGDPFTRCQEDPVRILRAIRFAAKLHFSLDPSLVEAIHELKSRLAAVPPARLFDEFLKLFLSGHATETFDLLLKYDLYRILFPLYGDTEHTEDQTSIAFIKQACANTDRRIAEGKPVTPAFLFAVLLWHQVEIRAAAFQKTGMSPIQSLQEAGRAVLHQQTAVISVPKRFRLPIREIWMGQARLRNRRGRRPYWMLAQPRFRAAYDFLLLRCEAGESQLQELVSWWDEFQIADDNEKKTLCQALQKGRKSRRGSRKKHTS